MTEFVSVYQGEKSKTVVTVTREFAESLGLDVLDQPAVSDSGKPLDAREVDETPSDLKGAALAEALEQADLPKTGNANEKRQRLAAHTAQNTEV